MLNSTRLKCIKVSLYCLVVTGPPSPFAWTPPWRRCQRSYPAPSGHLPSPQGLPPSPFRSPTSLRVSHSLSRFRLCEILSSLLYAYLRILLVAPSWNLPLPWNPLPIFLLFVSPLPPSLHLEEALTVSHTRMSSTF